MTMTNQVAPKSFFDYKSRLKTVQRLYQKPVVKNYLWLVITLITLSILGLAAIKPTAKTIAGLVAEIKQKRQISQQMTNKITSLTEAQVAYQSIQNRLGGLENAIPESPNFARLVWEIEYLALKNQVEIAQLKIGKIDLLSGSNLLNSKEPVKVSLDITLKGSWEQITGFSSDLEALNRIIQVDEVRFDKAKKAAENNNSLELVLSAEAFYLKGD